MDRHEIPTHLNVEDKAFAGLTMRQLMTVAIALALAYGAASEPPLPVPVRLIAAGLGPGSRGATRPLAAGGAAPGGLGLRPAALLGGASGRRLAAARCTRPSREDGGELRSRGSRRR